MNNLKTCPPMFIKIRLCNLKATKVKRYHLDKVRWFKKYYRKIGNRRKYFCTINRKVLFPDN